MKTLRSVLLCLLLGACTFGLIRFPAECSQAARDGLALSLETVLPSLFPFFVLSTLCIVCGPADALARALSGTMRPLFRLGGAGAGALVLGLIGPVGARTVAELYRSGALSRGEAERLLCFCNNAGPGFVLGICGGALFSSARAGAYLYLIHVLSAMAAGILLCRSASPLPTTSGKTSMRHEALSRAFPAAVRDSFSAVWSVCGFVILFAVLLRLLALAFPLVARVPILLGIVELTTGVLSLSATPAGFVGCAALLAWGGLSVHAQTLSVLGDLSPAWYFRGKLLQTCLSVPLAYLIALHIW